MLPISVFGHDWDISHSPFGVKANCQESNVKLLCHGLDLQQTVKSENSVKQSNIVWNPAVLCCAVF